LGEVGGMASELALWKRFGNATGGVTRSRRGSAPTARVRRGRRACTGW
jgi:hypothetical protein